LRRWGIPVLLSLALHAAAVFLLLGDRCTAAPPPVLLKARLVSLPIAPVGVPEQGMQPKSPPSLREKPPSAQPSKPARHPEKQSGQATAASSVGSGQASRDPAGTKVPEESPGAPVPQPVVSPETVREAREPDVLSRTKPLYPLASRKKGESGTVVLLVRLDESGKPIDISIHSSSGYPALDRSALTAVRSWKFRPDAPGLLLVPVVFRLE